MKELIVDRGYISGELIERLKKDFNVDTLIPLKKNMQAYRDAVAIATSKEDWKTMEYHLDDNNEKVPKMEVTTVNDITIWDSMSCNIHTTVVRCTNWDDENNSYVENYWVLASTKIYKKPEYAVERYRLRVQTEERFRQLKHSWYITDFPSPHSALVESHVCFTLFTYSLLQCNCSPLIH